MLPHLAGNVRQNFVLIVEFNLEHCSRQNRRDRAFKFNMLLAHSKADVQKESGTFTCRSSKFKINANTRDGHRPLHRHGDRHHGLLRVRHRHRRNRGQDVLREDVLR